MGGNGKFRSAELVSTSTGRQYHIGVSPGDAAPYILLCGDPKRAERTAELFVALVSACAHQGARYHVGLTASAPGFYGAQSRRVPGFEPRFKDMPRALAKVGVANLEMEISALFTLASVGGFRAGAVCAIF